MIITTADAIEGRSIAKTVGLVKGSTIRARHVGKDIMAAFRNMVGGEIVEYTKMMGESREQALARMIEDAEQQGANAIVGMRFTTSMVMQNASEILAYGTGVVLEGVGRRDPA
ncbi:MAG: heavy metal-binding domain-containing protein [Gammaproteobacteria bacterium]|nr:heavy metal-binding domain-containing protein [Gammaproteobacteria bacterium]